MLVLHLPQGTHDQSQLAFEERLVSEQPARIAEPKLRERDLDLLRELAGVVAAVRGGRPQQLPQPFASGITSLLADRSLRSARNLSTVLSSHRFRTPPSILNGFGKRPSLTMRHVVSREYGQCFRVFRSLNVSTVSPVIMAAFSFRLTMPTSQLLPAATPSLAHAFARVL
jgi:hypothetical protein